MATPASMQQKKVFAEHTVHKGVMVLAGVGHGKVRVWNVKRATGPTTVRGRNGAFLGKPTAPYPMPPITKTLPTDCAATLPAV